MFGRITFIQPQQEVYYSSHYKPSVSIEVILNFTKVIIRIGAVPAAQRIYLVGCQNISYSIPLLLTRSEVVTTASILPSDCTFK